MRFTSKLFLLVAAALAAMALGASAASASEPVEVEVEGAEHCDVNGGNCQVHVAGESSLVHPVIGVISACTDEYTAQFGEGGNGFIHSQSLVNDPATGNMCTRHPCPSTTWPITNTEEVGQDEVIGEVTFCLETDVTCTVPIHIEEIAAHVYEAQTAETMTSVGNGHPRCLSGPAAGLGVEGHWFFEGTDIEIEHDQA